MCKIHSDGHSSEGCRVLRDYGEKYRHQIASFGENTNKVVNVDKTSMNVKELNAMVKCAVPSALKGGIGKNKCTRVVEADIEASSEDEDL